MRPRTEPLRTPYKSLSTNLDTLEMINEIGLEPSYYGTTNANHACKQLISIEWSMVSNTADSPRRTSPAASPFDKERGH